MPFIPSALRRAAYRLRAIVFRGSLDSDARDEMREHIASSTERFVARGMTRAAAVEAAQREFGNLTKLRDEAHDARGARWAESLLGDMRFALRYFARHKATTVIVVAVIALGTGANTLIFSMLQAEFFRPAPAVAKDNSRVRIWAQERATLTGSWQQRRFSQPEVTALNGRNEIFRDVAAWTDDELILDSGDSTGARSILAQFVTTNYFTTLGVALVAGNGLRANGDGAPDMTTVMSSAMAQQLFGSASAAIGKRILVNENPVYVVGVAPPRFQGAIHNMHEPALWIPLSARSDIARVSPRWLTDAAALSLFARLAPDVSRERASAYAQQVVVNALPDSATRVGMARSAHVLPMHAPAPGRDSNEIVLAFAAMMSIGVLILLVAWMNVSSLMVAVAVGRQHEIAVRLSLGASRFRLMRQLVTESTVVAIAGSATGLTMAWGVLTWMTKTEIDGVELAPDLGTFAFVFAMALATGILFGLSPALHAVRGAVANALRESGAGTTGSGGRSRLQRGFVVAQIALSLPLLVLLGTVLSFVVADYRPLSPEMARHVITVGLRPLENGAPDQRPAAVDSLIPRIAQQPGVVAAVPEASGFAIRGVIAPNGTGKNVADSIPSIIHIEGTVPGWLNVVDVPVVLGRDVSWADTNATNFPVVIGTDLARRLWGDANPIGRELASPALRGLDQDSMSLTVIGVYDASHKLPGMAWEGEATRGSMSASVTRVYSAQGKKWRHDRILVRTRAPAAPYLPELQRYIRRQAPSLPVTSMLTFAQKDAQDYEESIRIATMAGAGGALALLLASLGLYGVVSLSVRQRTREIGIRIAVGAYPMQVARMFLLSGVRVSLLALALGLPLSIAALRIALSQGMLPATQVSPLLIGFVIAPLLLLVAAVATWIPARRAALVAPATTLRVE